MLESVRKELTRTDEGRDFVVLARRVVEKAIGAKLDGSPLLLDTVPINDSPAVLRGRKGGLKGGKARAKRLSAYKRHKIAKAAAKARWKK
jgi:hypothetical protein